MESKTIVLSSLAHTWILDLDGTIVKHNGYKIDGVDTLLPGAKEFLSQIPDGDYILFLTSREELYKEETERFLRESGIRFNTILYGLPYGERIVFNDDKPSGLRMSYGLTKTRNSDEFYRIIIDRGV